MFKFISNLFNTKKEKILKEWKNDEYTSEIYDVI
jgi:hypothetical protein